MHTVSAPRPQIKDDAVGLKFVARETVQVSSSLAIDIRTRRKPRFSKQHAVALSAKAANAKGALGGLTHARRRTAPVAKVEAEVFSGRCLCNLLSRACGPRRVIACGDLGAGECALARVAGATQYLLNGAWPLERFSERRNSRGLNQSAVSGLHRRIDRAWL